MTTGGTYTLYGGGVAQSASVEAVLRELDLAYTRKDVDVARKDARWDELLAVNPAGLVPALVLPDGTVMHETVAIMLFLADRHPAAALAPQTDNHLRAQFLARLFYINNEIAARTKGFFYAHRWSTDVRDVPRVRDAAFAAVMERWQLVETWLDGAGPYILADRFSIADVFLANWAAYGLRDGADIRRRFPAVARCLDVVALREKSEPVFTDLLAAVKAWRNG